MKNDLVAMLKKDFSLDMKHEYPQTCLTEYEYERQKASDHIEKLESVLRDVVVTLNSEEIPYMVRNRYACVIAEEALEGKDD